MKVGYPTQESAARSVSKRHRQLRGQRLWGMPETRRCGGETWREASARTVRRPDSTRAPARRRPSLPPDRRPVWSSPVSSVRKGSIRSMRSSGTFDRLSLGMKRARSSSSSATSRSPASGRSRRPTSSCRSISAARLARRSASAASNSSSAAWSTRSRPGHAIKSTSRARMTSRLSATT